VNENTVALAIRDDIRTTTELWALEKAFPGPFITMHKATTWKVTEVISQVRDIIEIDIAEKLHE